MYLCGNPKGFQFKNMRIDSSNVEVSQEFFAREFDKIRNQGLELTFGLKVWRVFVAANDKGRLIGISLHTPAYEHEHHRQDCYYGVGVLFEGVECTLDQTKEIVSAINDIFHIMLSKLLDSRAKHKFEDYGVFLSTLGQYENNVLMAFDSIIANAQVKFSSRASDHAHVDRRGMKPFFAASKDGAAVVLQAFLQQQNHLNQVDCFVIQDQETVNSLGATPSRELKKTKEVLESLSQTIDESVLHVKGYRLKNQLSHCVEQIRKTDKEIVLLSKDLVLLKDEYESLSKKINEITVLIERLKQQNLNLKDLHESSLVDINVFEKETGYNVLQEPVIQYQPDSSIDYNQVIDCQKDSYAMEGYNLVQNESPKIKSGVTRKNPISNSNKKMPSQVDNSREKKQTVHNMEYVILWGVGVLFLLLMILAVVFFYPKSSSDIKNADLTYKSPQITENQMSNVGMKGFDQAQNTVVDHEYDVAFILKSENKKNERWSPTIEVETKQPVSESIDIYADFRSESKSLNVEPCRIRKDERKCAFKIKSSFPQDESLKIDNIKIKQSLSQNFSIPKQCEFKLDATIKKCDGSSEFGM
jgi:hypothetical protein